MRLTRLLPSPIEEFDLETQWEETLSTLYATPQPIWLRINLIASVDGNAAGPDGTSNSLTNRTDRRILGAIRRSADLVLVGASSVRKEGYFLPRSAPLAIVTSSGNLSGHQIPSDLEEGRVIVLCPPEAREALRRSLGDRLVTVITLAGPHLDPDGMMGALRERGYNSIVCEGGPTVASRLLDADLVDEVCLSTSPTITGTTMPVFHGLSKNKKLQLTQLLVDPESALYARWAVQVEHEVQTESAARRAIP